MRILSQTYLNKGNSPVGLCWYIQGIFFNSLIENNLGKFTCITQLIKKSLDPKNLITATIFCFSKYGVFNNFSNPSN